MLDPAGQADFRYSGNVVLSGSTGEQLIPVALNDAPGRWKVRVKDMLTGQQQESVVEVY